MMNIATVTWGIMIPLIGTTLGAACVFFMWGEMNRRVQSALSGFAAGIMAAASVWSLLIPAIDRSEQLGKLAFLPAAAGFLGGVLFLLLIDLAVPRLFAETEANKNGGRLFFAVTLHNLPEGMAVGTVFAGLLAGEGGITLAAAMTLAIGVALQNIPEGAIISMPKYSSGETKWRAFAGGAMSGIVEPIGAAITVLAASVILPILPVLLGFAAGAMLYVVVEELIPEVMESGFSKTGNLAFALGFAVMMTFDVALG